MKEWNTYKLSDICDIFGRIGFRGYTSEDLVTDKENGAITLSPTNIVDGRIDLTKPTYIKWEKYYESPEIMLSVNDIVLSKTATIGRVAHIDELKHPMTLNPQLVVLKNIKVNPIFLSYFLKGPVFRGLLSSITVGSVIPTLSQKNLGNLLITLPPNHIQIKIANILESFDKKIKLNCRINDNLEQQAQALYKSWFIDFEPFKDIDFVESELGLIPDGWRCGLLSELLAIKYGKDHKKLSDGDIPVYGSGGIMRYVDTKLYEGEAVLIPRKGSLNNVMYVNEAFWTVDTMFYSTAKESNSGIYSYLFLTNKDLASMNAGSAVPSMTTDILNNLQLIIPPKEVLKSFNTLCFILFKRMKQNIIENMNLGNQRDSLLPKLMSGELKINDLDC